MFKCFFLTENIHILIEISLKFVPNFLINDKSALVKVMSLWPTGDKTTPELMLTTFHDAICRHFATMG